MTSGPRLRIVVVQPEGDVRLSEAMAGDPATEIAAVTSDGMRAVSMTRRLRPNAVVMDAGIPNGAAFVATRRIMAESPTPVIMAIDDGAREAAALRLEALQAGAILVVPKPPDRETPQFAKRRSGLIAAVHTLAPMKLEPIARSSTAGSAAGTEVVRGRRAAVVAIASSTGGPAALCRILAELPADFGAPILLTQHITQGFVDGMARWLNGLGPLRVKLAEHGEALKPATVYIAGDACHLTARDDRTIALADTPPVHGHRPSATVMFRSVAAVFGRSALAAILTGMGDDGIDGLVDIRRAGGVVVAQDEASSAVFGMPKAAIEAGLVDRILPLDEFARHLIKAVGAT
jgi:two-component system chemotaxis response regulator CheB